MTDWKIVSRGIRNMPKGMGEGSRMYARYFCETRKQWNQVLEKAAWYRECMVEDAPQTACGSLIRVEERGYTYLYQIAMHGDNWALAFALTDDVQRWEREKKTEEKEEVIAWLERHIATLPENDKDLEQLRDRVAQLRAEISA